MKGVCKNNQDTFYTYVKTPITKCANVLNVTSTYHKYVQANISTNQIPCFPKQKTKIQPGMDIRNNQMISPRAEVNQDVRITSTLQIYCKLN